MNYMQRPSSGFTLIELSIVIMIFGLIMGGMFSFLSVKTDREHYQTTVDREKKIAVALSDYQHINGTLPCPAQPNVTPLGQSPSACTTMASRNGIVPFRNLGLTQLDVTDGYGNPFTYASTKYATNLAVNNAFGVQQDCRKPLYWVRPGPTNNNTAKAYFCCQQALDNDTDVIRALDTSSGNTVALTQGTTALSNMSGANTVATMMPNNVTTVPLAYFAYVLVSHGPNGYGAKVFGSTAKKDYTNASTDELENIDSNNVFVDKPITTASLGVNYQFDDIVMWRTQEGVVSETNTDDCSRP